MQISILDVKMKGFLGLASDFVDQLTNVASGVDTNEAYAVRLESLLTADKSLAESLVTAGRELAAEDVDLLSSSGWRWLMRFAASHGQLLSREFLRALFDETGDPITRVRIIEVVTDLAERPYTTGRRDDKSQSSIDQLSEPWLQALLRSVVRSEHVDIADISRAHELVTMFMQVGNELSLLSASLLLAHQWEGHALLRERVGNQLSGLDAPTQREWRRLLGLIDQTENGDGV